jgi:hypothetical protein
MGTTEFRMVHALFTETRLGPNDELLNQHSRKAYWISTIRYPEAGWQTGVFDRQRFFWLSRPIFRVNEMENPVRALLNHLITIVVVAESSPESWPKGMSWTEPSETSWSDARTKVLVECPSGENPEEIIDYYSKLRSRYQCVHL